MTPKAGRLTALRTSLSVLEKLSPARRYGRRVLEASVLRQAVELSDSLGRRAVASRYLSRCQALVPSLPEPFRTEVDVFVKETLGRHLFEEGAWEAALATLKDCMLIAPVATKATCCHLVGAVYDTAGDHEASFAYYCRAFELTAESPERQFLRELAALLGVLDSYSALPGVLRGDTIPDARAESRVRSYVERVAPGAGPDLFRDSLEGLLGELDRFTAGLEPGSPRHASALEQRSELLHRLGSVLLWGESELQKRKGIRYLEECLRNRPAGSIGLAEATSTLAIRRLVAFPSEVRRPLDLSEEAVRIGRGHPFSPKLPGILYLRGLILIGAGDFQDALAAFREGWMVVRRLCSAAGEPGWSSRHAFLDQAAPLKHEYCRLLLRLDLRRELFDVCDEYRLFEAGTAVVAARTAEGRAPFRRPGSRTAYREALLEIEAARGGEWLPTDRPARLTLAQRGLGPKDALLFYVDDAKGRLSGASDPFVWAITRDADRIHKLQPGGARLAETASMRILARARSDPARASALDWAEAGKAIAENLLPDEAARIVSDADHVFVCPDVGMWDIAWNLTLVDGGHLFRHRSMSLLHASGMILGRIDPARENFLAAGVDDEKEDVPSQKRRSVGKLLKGVLFSEKMAVPGRSPNHTPTTDVADASSGDVRLRVCRTDDGAGSTQGRPIRSAEQEARAIAKTYGSLRDEALCGFLGDHVKAMVGSAQVVHLCGHGFSEREAPRRGGDARRLMPYVSGVKGRAEISGAIVEKNISHRELISGASTDGAGRTAALIVLSACNCAQGESHGGVGLDNSVLRLMQAGCSACVCSKTPLVDGWIMGVMSRAHALFTGSPLSVSDALRESASKDSPSLWAGLTVFGNGRLRFAEIAPRDRG